MFNGFPDYKGIFLSHVSEDIQARCASGRPIGLEEWKTLRANSYERKFMEPFLTDEAFLYNLDICIRNVQTEYVGPYGLARDYNVYIMTDGIHELRKRFKGKLETEKQLREALHKIGSWRVCAGITTPEDMAQSFEPMLELVQKSLGEIP